MRLRATQSCMPVTSLLSSCTSPYTFCFIKSHVSYAVVKCGVCLRFVLCHWRIYMHLRTLTTCEYSIIGLEVFPFIYSLVWDLTQRRLGTSYRRFGTTCWSYIQGYSSSWKKIFVDCVTLDVDTDGFSRIVGNVTTNLRHVTSQNSEYLMWRRKPWNAHRISVSLPCKKQKNKDSFVWYILSVWGTEGNVRILDLKNNNYVPKFIFSLFSCEPNLYLLNVVWKYPWQCSKYLV